MDQQQYVAVVPVKPPAVGKSRLGLSGDRRRELAAAFALDTVTACLATRPVAQVLAVTDDAAFARDLAAAGCAVLPDGPSGDLNTSLVLAAAEARRRWPDLRPVAVCADLPALRPDDLAEALAIAADPRVRLRRGRRRHRHHDVRRDRRDASCPASGPAPGPPTSTVGRSRSPACSPSLRQDVDDLVDLGRAEALGLGPHTARLEMP